jgi:hypothetical protein
MCPIVVRVNSFRDKYFALNAFRLLLSFVGGSFFPDENPIAIKMIRKVIIFLFAISIAPSCLLAQRIRGNKDQDHWIQERDRDDARPHGDDKSLSNNVFDEPYEKNAISLTATKYDLPTCPQSVIAGFFVFDFEITNMLPNRRCKDKIADIEAAITFTVDQANVNLKRKFPEKPLVSSSLCSDADQDEGIRRRLGFRGRRFRGGGSCAWCWDDDQDRQLVQNEDSLYLLSDSSAKSTKKQEGFLEELRFLLASGLIRNLSSAFEEGVCFKEGELPEVNVHIISTGKEDAEAVVNSC